MAILFLLQSVAEELVVPIPRFMPFPRNPQECLHVSIGIQMDFLSLTIDWYNMSSEEGLLELSSVQNGLGQMRRGCFGKHLD